MPVNESVETVETIVVGAGPAGLSVAAHLAHQGRQAVILEQGESAGESWAQRYESLRLHTTRRQSALPFVALPAGERYPSQAEILAYLRAYPARRELNVRPGTRVLKIERGGAGWRTHSAEAILDSSNLVLATGFHHLPKIPALPGEGRFRPALLHSADYRRGEPFRGQRVLVVGFGNSGADIAADLWRSGSRPAISVRGPVHLVPLEIAGINWRSVQTLCPEILMALGRRVSRRAETLAERASALLWHVLQQRAGAGLEEHGIALKSAREIAAHWRERRPILTAGPGVDLVRRGDVEVFPAIVELEEECVRFADGRRERFDRLIFATGFRPDLELLLASPLPRTPAGDFLEGAQPGLPGLYVCGLQQLLSRIRNSARRIAADISRRAGLDSGLRAGPPSGEPQ